MPNEIIIEMQDNSNEVLEEFSAACLRTLEKCGMTAEGYAKDLQVPDTGLLRNSITHAVGGEAPAITMYKADNPKPGRKNSGEYSGTAPEDEKGKMSVYIGTNVEYAAYQELGTGKYYEGGSPKPWSYTDSKGEKHWTAGNPAHPYLKPAVADHVQTYKNIIEHELKNG